MRRLTIVLGAALLAVASFLAALSQAGQRIALPAAAAAFPLDGHARGRLAATLYNARQAARRDPALAPSAREVALARAAYLREPYSPDVLYVLARDAGARKEGAALPILLVARDISRRSQAVSLGLLGEYASRGREREGLAVLDEVLRRQTPAHGLILATLANYVGERQLWNGLLQLLATRPPWNDQFWRQLAQSPQGLDGAAGLRLAFQRQGGTVDPEVDRLLIAGLAGHGQLDDAERLAKALFPQAGIGRASGGELVRNGTFTRNPDYLPFDWRLFNAGDFGASLDRDRKQLLISALGGSRGVAAEQLVRLAGGPLRLDAAMQPNQAAAAARTLRYTVTCASAQGTGNVLLSATAAELPRQFSPQGCRWAWVRILVEVPSGTDGYDFSISRISLRPGQS